MAVGFATGFTISGFRAEMGLQDRERGYSNYHLGFAIGLTTFVAITGKQSLDTGIDGFQRFTIWGAMLGFSWVRIFFSFFFNFNDFVK